MEGSGCGVVVRVCEGVEEREVSRVGDGVGYVRFLRL